MDPGWLSKVDASSGPSVAGYSEESSNLVGASEEMAGDAYQSAADVNIVKCSPALRQTDAQIEDARQRSRTPDRDSLLESV